MGHLRTVVSISKYSFLLCCICYVFVSCNQVDPLVEGHQLIGAGDELHIRYKGPGEVVQFKIFEGLNLLLKQNSNGVFEGRLIIPNVDDAIFSYEILVYQKDSTGKMQQIFYEPDDGRHFRYIGKDRKIGLIKPDLLAGIQRTDTLMSEYLDDSREVDVYFPNEFGADTPIIYFPDGSVVKSYAPFVDKMIASGEIYPIIMIGFHSSDTHRYEEYVPNPFLGKELFYSHETFVLREVLPHYEQQVSNFSGSRYLYGFSNGGAFCMYLGLNHSDLFEEVVAFSTADYISEFMQPIELKDQYYPSFYMGAGIYEESLYNDNLRFVKKLEDHGIDVHFQKFISGHDYFVWQVEFLEFVRERFSKN